MARAARARYRRAGWGDRREPGPVPERRHRLGVRPAVVRHPQRRPDLGEDRDPRAAGDRPGDGGRPRVRGVGQVHRHGCGLRSGLHEVFPVLQRRRARTMVSGAWCDRPGLELATGRGRGALLGAARAHRQPWLPARPRTARCTRARSRRQRAGGRHRPAARPRSPAAACPGQPWPPGCPEVHAGRDRFRAGGDVRGPDARRTSRQDIVYSTGRRADLDAGRFRPGTGDAMSLSRHAQPARSLVATSEGIEVSSQRGGNGQPALAHRPGRVDTRRLLLCRDDHRRTGSRDPGGHQPARRMVHLRRRRHWQPSPVR